jgi:hypothetical protein
LRNKEVNNEEVKNNGGNGEGCDELIKQEERMMKTEAKGKEDKVEAQGDGE